jgi:hypothetical protein
MARDDRKKITVRSPDGKTVKQMEARNAYDHVNHLGWTIDADKEASDYTPPEAHAERDVKTIEEQLKQKRQKAEAAGRAKSRRKVPASRNEGALEMGHDDTEAQANAIHKRMDAAQDLEPLEDADEVGGDEAID